MQIFSNAGQDEAEKIRDEATRLLGDGGGLVVPSKCSYSRIIILHSFSAIVQLGLFEHSAFQYFCGVVEADRSGTTANQAEFHEFNFGHDVMAESERVLQELGRGTVTGDLDDSNTRSQ